MSDFVPTIMKASSVNIEAVVKAAEADNHVVVGASHVVLKDNEIIGYIGIATIPTVHLWMDSKKAKARDSLFIQAFTEEVLNHHIIPNGGIYMLPCQRTSPYFKLLESVGYKKTTYTDVFVKTLPPT